MSLIEHLNPPCLKPCVRNNEVRCGSCDNCNWCINERMNGKCVPNRRFTPENCPNSFEPPRPPRPHPRPHRHHHHRHYTRRTVVVDDVDDSNDNSMYQLNALVTISLIIIVLIMLIMIYYAI